MDKSGIEALCRECPEDLLRAKKEASALIKQAEPHLPSMQAWAGRLISHLTAPGAPGH
jgi:hypothetical protein